QRPSILLLRAVALKRSSSSRANCFSKPSSRLSNVVVMPPSLTLLPHNSLQKIFPGFAKRACGPRLSKARTYEVNFRLAYRQLTVKAPSAGPFAQKVRSGKREAGVNVLPLVIG